MTGLSPGPPLKVCMITGIFPPQIGGPATQCLHLCQTLQRHGVQVFVVTFGERTASEEYEGVRVYRHRLRYPGGPLGKVLRLGLFSLRFVRLLRKERPSVVHCHDTYPHALLAGAVCRLLRVPTVVKFAGDLVYEKVNVDAMKSGSIRSAHQAGLRSRALARVERWGLRRFSVVWAASEFRRRNLVEDLRIDAAKVRVIPNYILLPRPPDALRPPTPPVFVLSAGRFAPHKRLDRTLQVLALLERPGVRLRLAGGGSPQEERAVRDLIAHLRLQDRVDVVGKVSYDELLRVMQTSHVLLSTSEEEGFGIVFVEAMALGLPVVALRIGAIPEVVPDGKAGFLLEASDTAGIVEKLGLLADDSSLREAMGDFGRAHAQRYDIDRQWSAFTDLYAELQQGRHATAHNRSAPETARPRQGSRARRP